MVIYFSLGNPRYVGGLHTFRFRLDEDIQIQCERFIHLVLFMIEEVGVLQFIDLGLMNIFLMFLLQ